MNAPLLDTRGIVVVLIYLLSLLGLGFLANRASKESNLKDYYLAGSSLGIVGLFFTLYATQYSGTSLFATPGKAYRGGVIALSMLFGMMGIIFVYSVIGPTLIAYQRTSICDGGDFVLWRFENKGLLVMMNIVFIITLTNYTLANLKAIGFLLESATGGGVSFAAGICLVCWIMAMYESLGGMRSVVWTDIIQGVLLMFGCLLVFIFLQAFHEPERMITPKVFTSEVKSFFSHSTNTGNFVSLSLLIALGAAVYPQAIQRIYAATDVPTLRRSYQMLLLMPLVTVLPLILIGMSATEWFPDLSPQESERVVILAINQLAEQLPTVSWLLILYLSAAIAAIMSTIDSALLSLGSIVSKDIIARRFRNFDDRRLSSVQSTVDLGVNVDHGCARDSVATDNLDINGV